MQDQPKVARASYINSSNTKHTQHKNTIIKKIYFSNATLQVSELKQRL